MISIGNFSQPVSGFKTATCTCSELSSAQIQYAVFMMYENSNLVASRIESVMIVKGLTSKAEISLSYDDLKTYAVVISLKKDNEKWEYSDKEIVLINKDDPSVPPVILEDTYGDGTFYGKSVPDGNYDIYIRDAGDSENGTNTTISYNPKNANQPDAPKVNVEFNTITNPSSTVKITPTSPMTGVMSGEDEDEILIIQGYTDPIEFTIETKPGYEADPNGSGISINGTTVILNDGSPNPQTDTNTAPGAQYKITPSVLENLTENSFQGTSLIEYNLTLDPNGGTWDDNSTEVKNFKYTVENLTLPANLTKTSYDFNGWKPSGSSTTFKTIPQGTIGNLQLEATWKDGPKSETKPGSANDKWTEEEISNTDIVGKIFACG